MARSKTSKRGYERDLRSSVLNSLTPERHQEIRLSLLRENLRIPGELFEAGHDLRIWAGPGGSNGVGGVRRQMATGDLFAVILGDEFIALSRIVAAFAVSPETGREISTRLWQDRDYTEFWLLDHVVHINVWRREIAARLTDNADYFTKGKGALFSNQFQNLGKLPDEILANAGGGEGFLEALGASPDFFR